jgi:hypothetical protein
MQHASNINRDSWRVIQRILLMSHGEEVSIRVELITPKMLWGLMRWILVLKTNKDNLKRRASRFMQSSIARLVGSILKQ